jgi:hypothetical protein
LVTAGAVEHPVMAETGPETATRPTESSRGLRMPFASYRLGVQ